MKASDTGRCPAVRPRAFYLDTSAIRALGKRLPDSPTFNQSLTSAVTLVELLAGAARSADEHYRCRAAARAVFRSGLHVEWTMPEVKIGEAFPALLQMGTIEDGRSEALKALVERLCNSDTPATFRESCAARSLEDYGLAYFEDYDATFGDDFNRASERFDRELRREFQQPGLDQQLHALGLPPGLSARQFSRRFSVHPLNYASSVLAVALKIAEHVGRTDESFVKALYDSYDRSIDCYLLATSIKSMERPATGEVPGRNDALDLAHFVYPSPKTELVSDDRAMCALGRSIGVEVRGSQQWLRRPLE